MDNIFYWRDLMSRDKTLETAEKLVAYCRENNTESCLNELYHPDAVSIESIAMEGADSVETKGLDAIKGKHDWWYSSFETHSSSLDGPFLHGDDRFGVIFEFDVSHKESGERTAMKEIAIYTVEDGKIVKEEFYYN